MAAEEPAEEPAEELAHAEVLELFQAALARLVQDPLLCDLPPQVSPGRGAGPGRAGLRSRPCRSPAGDGGGDRLAGGPGVRAGHDGAGVQGGRRDRACVRGRAGRPGGGRGAAGLTRLSPPAAVVVVQNASVLELKKALRRHMQLRQARQGGVQHLSW